MCNMDEKLCAEKHKTIEEKLNAHDTRLNNYGNRIDDLEQHKAGVVVQIENLCKKIDGLIKSIQWGSGVIITTLIGFFIWYIQNIR